MPISSKALKRTVIALAIAAVLGFVVIRTWVVPVVIAGQIQAHVGGKVTIRDWWLDGRSAGVVGLSLHEGPGAGSSAWATAERVEADLSLGRLLRGRFMPGRVTLVRPVLDFRLDRDGRFRNLPEFRGGVGGPSRVPEVVVQDARVVFRQEGRPEMAVSGVSGRLRPGRDVLVVSAEADDPSWGRWDASGAIDPGFGEGSVRLDGERFEADPAKLASVPFVPPDVWANVAPTGPARVALVLGWGTGGASPVRTRVEVTFLGTKGVFPTLGLATTGTTGRLVIEGGVVHVEHLEGESLGGRVAASGTLDFSRTPSRIDLDLDLTKVDVADAPKKWQLDEAGLTGRLTGKVKLRAALAAAGADLSGTSGEGVVEGGTIQGIPFKTLRLAMQASGHDLQYNTKAAGEARIDGPRPLPLRRVGTAHRLPEDARWAVPTLRRLAGVLVALQPPAEPKKAGGVQLPRTITTQIELEDVDVSQLIGRAQLLLGAPIPVPITGRMSLKAEATIPLGELRDLRAYVFRGDVTLSGASIFRVDFGRLESRIDLADGVLELTDLRGRLVDRPDGGPDNPPEASTAVAAKGPLPPGGFRAHVRAELSPPGRLAVRFDGDQLPLGELAAPVLPRPTPLSGLATIALEAAADLREAREPSSWAASGRVESVRVSYRGAALDDAALRFDLRQGRLDVQELAAHLLGRPLVARGEVDLKPPRAFRGTLDVTDWDLAALLALIPGAPRPETAAGLLSAHAEAKGTASPWTIETQGRGRLSSFRAGPVPLGDVPFRWTTEGDAVDLSVVEAHPFGGELTAQARVPTVAGKATEGTATFSAIDASRITAAMPGQDLKLSGKADGEVRFAIPADASALEATVRLSAPDLTVQGIPAERVRASVQARRGVLRYEVTADSLGGKVKLQGDFPLSSATAAPPGPDATAVAVAAADAELRAAGFALDRAWRALGLTGVLARLGGLGAIDANLRAIPAGPDSGLYAHGVVEMRNLSWGAYPLGRLRGIVVRTPASWRVEPLSGDILGGLASGFLWGTTPARGGRRLGFDLRLDRASLKRALAFEPMLANNFDGDGTIRLAGDLGETFRATAELDVAGARFAGLPLMELRAPAELSLVPETGSGVLQVRRWSSRLAGGHLRGDAWFRLGEDRAFRSDVQLSAIDLQAIARLLTDARRPASGRISGTVSLSGPDPSLPSGYRGRVVLDLDDASLVAMPIIGEINRFLGAAQGGVFEDGDLSGTIGHRQVIIDMFTLQGRLAQLHMTGTVGFDGQLNLGVLINTNQIIPQTGQALIAVIPGLRDALGRGQAAVLPVANFLSNRLLKLRVTGTLKSPTVAIDPSVAVADTAVGFFAGVLKLPLGLVK
jgi:translocation and assembly module TamB